MFSTVVATSLFSKRFAFAAAYQTSIYRGVTYAMQGVRLSDQSGPTNPFRLTVLVWGSIVFGITHVPLLPTRSVYSRNLYILDLHFRQSLNSRSTRLGLSRVQPTRLGLSEGTYSLRAFGGRSYRRPRNRLLNQQLVPTLGVGWMGVNNFFHIKRK